MGIDLRTAARTQLHRGGLDKSSARSVQEWPVLAHYALSIGTVVAALIVRLPLNPLLGERVPFLTIFMVLLPLVLLVRPGPFLAASLVGLVGALLLFPSRLLELDDPATVVELVLYGLVAVAATTTAWLSQRAQWRQRSADAMLRAFVDESPTCKWVTAPDGRIVYVNRAMAAALGRPVREILGRTHADLLPPKLARLAQDRIQSVRTTGQSSMSFEEIEAPHGASERHILEWRRFALRVSEQDHILVAGMANDVTERKRLEQEVQEHSRRLEAALAQRTEEVKRAERALATSERMATVGTLASGLAHDINNITLPLGSRIDDLLNKPALDPKVKSELAIITALLDHLRMMSRNLSLFSRDPEQDGIMGSTELASWCVNVQGLLEASISSKGGRATDRRLRLKCDVPTGLPPINIAPHRLSQAMLNVVLNARDAILAACEQSGAAPRRETGCIRIEARPRDDGRAVLLKVIDDGCGMDAETVRRAIEPFFTTKVRPSTAGAGGSGLGLALAHAICHRSGGQLHIESEPGKGTTVTLTLPAVQQSAVDAPRHVGKPDIQVQASAGSG